MVLPRSKDIRLTLHFLAKSKAKFVSLDMCANAIGIYSDVLGEELSYFAPSIMLDPSFNLKSLVPYLEEYLAKRKKERRKVKPASQREVDAYDSVAAFVYSKMTSAGGLVDPSLRLDDHDLRLLAKVVKKRTRPSQKEVQIGPSGPFLLPCLG